MSIKSINGEPIVVYGITLDNMAEPERSMLDNTKDDLSGLYEHIEDTETVSVTWLQGGIIEATGGSGSAANRLRSGGYFETDLIGVVHFNIPDGLLIRVYTWTNNAYSGVLKDTWFAGQAYLIPKAGVKYRVSLKVEDGSDIAPSDSRLADMVITSGGTTFKNVKDEMARLEGATHVNKSRKVSRWIQGTINNNGTNIDSTTRVRSSGFMHLEGSDTVTIECDSGLQFNIHEWIGDGATYVGRASSSWIQSGYEFAPTEGHTYRFVCALTSNENLSPSDSILDSFVIVSSMTIGEALENIEVTDVYDTHMASSDVGNSGILCAKEHHYIDGTPPKTEWYLLGDPSTNKVYYSKDMEERAYLFTFDGTLGEWSFGIDSANNIICCAQAEYLASEYVHDDGVRKNPIVYLKSEDYRSAHEVDFGTGIKPVGWLSSVGFICLNSGNILISEYTRPTVRTANVWRISGDPTDPTNWSVKYTFTLSGDTQDGFKHIHCVQQDHFTGVCYFGTGDDDTSSHIFYSLDDGVTWIAGKENSEKYCRLLNIVFTETYCYWSTDSRIAGKHYVFRVARNNDGVIDFDNIEDMVDAYYQGLATYGTAYLEDLNAILLVERLEGVTAEQIPVRLYDIANNELVNVYWLKSATTARGGLGFRTRFCEWYPRNDVVRLSWHLLGSTLGTAGYNVNRMFGNLASTNAANNINNADLIISKVDGSYKMVIDTHYI